MHFKIFILTVCASACAASWADDTVFDLNHDGNDLRFDLTNFQELQTKDFLKLNDVYSITIQLKAMSCDGFRSKVCLIKNEKYETDIGSKINEVKLDVENRLFMSLEGNGICGKNKKYTTDITFICDRNKTQIIVINTPDVNNCKYILELTSITGCPIDDMDIRKMCDVLQVPHSFYRFNLSPLRRLTSNYQVKNKNRHFELNICGRLMDTNNCNGRGTTICDITNKTNPEVFAVGYSTNDNLLFDTRESQSLKLIQHGIASYKKGRQIEFIFKCNENIPPEKTNPEFISQNYTKEYPKSITYFEVATSVVCIPRMALCEFMSDYNNFNLKPLHKRMGNYIVSNTKSGGHFYLNICSYLNQYREEIPTSCLGKTSACYVDPTGKGISIGSTQVGPYYTGNSILLNYTDGALCIGSVKWSTIINLTCSDDSLLHYDSTNSALCVHLFQWKSHLACTRMFERRSQCIVTHPHFTGVGFNFNDLKSQSFDYEFNDYEDNTKFQISICRPLQISCNGNLDSAVCWFINGIEINIALFTEEIVYDNGKIFIYMQGEKCDNDGPISLTTIQFVCDYSDSKHINLKKDIHECTFEFIIYTKYACTPPLKTNCTVEDESGNIYDLSKFTKLDSNYEITISPKKKIILNVCHSVINNNIDGIACQFGSGICLVDSNNLLTSDCSSSLGDVYKGLKKIGNKIIIEMQNGFYNYNSVRSVIEFTCSNQTIGPLFTKEEEHTIIISWSTPLVCHTRVQKSIKDQINNNRIMSTHNILINGLNYSTYICPKYDINCISVDSNSNGTTNSGRSVILTVNENKIKYTLIQNSYFYYFIHESNNTYGGKANETEKIIFHFVCGFELQKPKLEKTSWAIKVLSIDPEMCSQKLECNASWYDITPLKGNYILKNKSEKYYINMCMPGKYGVGGMMELDGKNYSLGYQVALPKNEVSDSVEIIFKGGDYCTEVEQTNIPRLFSAIIRLECDPTQLKGNPIYLAKSEDKCELLFLWKTSLVCHKKLVEFNTPTCTANFNDFTNSFIIDMKNMLNTNRFIDSTNMVYHVDFCNSSVCLNDTKCIGGMHLEYDTYTKQFIAWFKEMNNDIIHLNIKMACPKASENLSKATFSITDNGIIEINTYSEDVCCITIDHSEKKLCKKNTLLYTTAVTLGNTLLHTTAVDSSHFTSVPKMEKEVSGSFYFSGLLILSILLGSFIWIFRSILWIKVQKLFFSNLSRRRERRQYLVPIDQSDL